jgi:hypothetical protein
MKILAEQITGADSKGHAAVKFSNFREERASCEVLVPLAACSFLALAK